MLLTLDPMRYLLWLLLIHIENQIFWRLWFADWESDCCDLQVRQCQLQVPDENATYILEPVTNEEYYQDDQNIMWIQETVEVEQVNQRNRKRDSNFQFSILCFTARELRLAAQRGDHPQPQRDGERGADAGARHEPRDHQGRHRARDQPAGLMLSQFSQKNLTLCSSGGGYRSTVERPKHEHQVPPTPAAEARSHRCQTSLCKPGGCRNL